MKERREGEEKEEVGGKTRGRIGVAQKQCAHSRNRDGKRGNLRLLDIGGVTGSPVVSTDFAREWVGKFVPGADRVRAATLGARLLDAIGLGEKERIAEYSLVADLGGVERTSSVGSGSIYLRLDELFLDRGCRCRGMRGIFL
jgi:hypothetical protein